MQSRHRKKEGKEKDKDQRQLAQSAEEKARVREIRRGGQEEKSRQNGSTLSCVTSMPKQKRRKKGKRKGREKGPLHDSQQNKRKRRGTKKG